MDQPATMTRKPTNPPPTANVTRTERTKEKQPQQQQILIQTNKIIQNNKKIHLSNQKPKPKSHRIQQ
ncbi:hypothetical protein TI04_09885 [Achromatium sp. WMS2]|nr:hypothetical protein TI04_09885 [Achromatium sp. WMS2]